jgi:ADP-heptose:LPS heptosyltransferase
MQKFLLIRFSSMGDIVLCSPVIRSLKKKYPEAEIHFLTKKTHFSLLAHNPYLSRVHLLEEKNTSLLSQLKAEKFSYIFDLHNNLRSLRFRLALRRPSRTFNKQNINKWLMTQPWLRPLAGSIAHVVERYAETLLPVGAPLDEQGLDFFLPEELEAWAQQLLQGHWGERQQVLAVVLGATYPTKRWLPEHFVSTLNQLRRPVLLLGGPDTRPEADQLIRQLDVPVYDAVAKHKVLEAAALMKQAQAVLTHDTGFMHIAAAFQLPIYSLWGNTVPEFGMTPFRCQHTVLEVADLSCRPCSKLGSQRCPQGHFRCMRELSPDQVVKAMRGGL